jgi:galactose mutarotase-like enzyme
VPPNRQHVAIEPMTAEIDALGRGSAPMVEPGDRFRASFRITVSR